MLTNAEAWMILQLAQAERARLTTALEGRKAQFAREILESNLSIVNSIISSLNNQANEWLIKELKAVN